MAISPACGSCDTFEWLALMDVLGFEDFEFTVLCGQLTPLMLDMPQPGLLKFSLASGKRFFLICDVDAQSDPCFRPTDIVCLYSSMPLVAGDVFIAQAERFNALVRQGLRTCLLYRCEGGALGQALEECTCAAVRIEWETPYMHAEEQRSGLMLSSGWRTGISEHAASLIANYMHTRARSGDALAQRSCLDEVEKL
ncbi:hypothetical protein [Xanthomonas albilineans]|uniref:hypothetical protein n=1 Tax=Xanthomonas albilineans TaxID=29447 RepID=UPI0005F34EDF|nr:hypothetical protein [Xanthomonas albilineans]